MYLTRECAEKLLNALQSGISVCRFVSSSDPTAYIESNDVGFQLVDDTQNSVLTLLINVAIYPSFVFEYSRVEFYDNAGVLLIYDIFSPALVLSPAQNVLQYAVRLAYSPPP